MSSNKAVNAAISAYNSDKVELQDSITKVYHDIREHSKNTHEYKDIENETYRLYNRQQAVYHMVATLALVSVIITLHRLT